jgi:hypothetical protein
VTVERLDQRATPTPYDDMWRLSQRIASTEFVPSSLRGRPEAVLACILFGRDLGLGEMVALANIGMINGRPNLSAEIVRALVKRAGHTLIWEHTDATKATLTGVRADDKTTLTLTWTLADAQTAGLITLDTEGKPVSQTKDGKPLPWQGYTRTMLRERVTTELCGALFGDVLAGIATPVDTIGAEPEPLEAQVNLDGTVELVPAESVTGPAGPSRRGDVTGGPGGVGEVTGGPAAETDLDTDGGPDR